jgi:hypothetical protein
MTEDQQIDLDFQSAWDAGERTGRRVGWNEALEYVAEFIKNTPTGPSVATIILALKKD